MAEENKKEIILVVDDVPANLQIVEAILVQQGYKVVCKPSGSEALEYLQNGTADLVLLDVMMPELNGFATASLIKATQGCTDLPIIFLTALSEKQEVVQGFEAGGVDYIPKPFHKAELLMRVKTQLALKQAREDLTQKNRDLEALAQDLKAANLARDKFFSILAHDLKNPFGGLMGLIDQVITGLETLTQEDLKEIFVTIQTSSKNVNHLLETLLEWGMAQTGDLVMDFQNLKVSDLILINYSYLKNSFSAKNITFETDLNCSEVYADEHTLSTVFRNLLGNALKFTPQGGSVYVAARDDGNDIVICFKDTGVGITPERLNKLFRLDTKISTPGTNRESGTGLGLILVKEFLGRNHGSIAIQSQPGAGTEFELRLPRKKDI